MLWMLICPPSSSQLISTSSRRFTKPAVSEPAAETGSNTPQRCCAPLLPHLHRLVSAHRLAGELWGPFWGPLEPYSGFWAAAGAPHRGAPRSRAAPLVLVPSAWRLRQDAVLGLGLSVASTAPGDGVPSLYSGVQRLFLLAARRGLPPLCTMHNATQLRWGAWCSGRGRYM
ncbi:hypothetical protein TARUN_3163 [Trichoderma arundinaceum]|uniref:Uncharacterized protein n=1 Tax=Trichoderma arundinaceum TaxID=490622 RepID=A0A395NSV3_TRIAR|nr:hypothetical protein TARUN_3163 [Trichoderma arundinaceum]